MLGVSHARLCNGKLPALSVGNVFTDSGLPDGCMRTALLQSAFVKYCKKSSCNNMRTLLSTLFLFVVVDHHGVERDV